MTEDQRVLLEFLRKMFPQELPTSYEIKPMTRERAVCPVQTDWTVEEILAREG